MLNIPKISTNRIQGRIFLPTSKSIEIRMLMIRALAGKPIVKNGDESSRDVELMTEALEFDKELMDFEDAGTPFRFYLAYAALKGLPTVMTGNDRLKKRPLKALIKALESLGARFEYLEEEGSLPLKVVQSLDLAKSEIRIDATISSQFVSALMLIAPFFKKGLEIELLGEPSSTPYLNLTAECMSKAGIHVEMDEEWIEVAAGNYRVPAVWPIETDWSAACFIYAWVALCESADILIPGLNRDSYQGDSMAVFMFQEFGVKTTFIKEGVQLSRATASETQSIFDVQDVPDMFPVLVALSAIKRTKVVFMGVKNLRHKESDRIESMRRNLEQCGVQIREIEADTVELVYSDQILSNEYNFKSFGDHRIAMACSLFAFEKNISIDDETVVAKSFPEYWNIFRDVLRMGNDN